MATSLNQESARIYQFPAGGRAALVSVCCSALLVVVFGLVPGPVFHYLQQQPKQRAAAAQLPAPGEVQSAGLR